MSEVKPYSSSFFSWLYPSRCALCSLLGDEAICNSCLQDFEPIDHVVRSSDGPLQTTATLFGYRGRVGQAVRRLKYSRATALAAPMATMMEMGMQRIGLVEHDLVIPIPIHWSRRCLRGFNQSELLSEAMPMGRRDLLARTRRTKPQVQLSREARMHNLDGAFRAAPAVAGKSILLIDDVLTSGQTARECAKALKEAGAKEVSALAFAGEAF